MLECTGESLKITNCGSEKVLDKKRGSIPNYRDGASGCIVMRLKLFWCPYDVPGDLIPPTDQVYPCPIPQ